MQTIMKIKSILLLFSALVFTIACTKSDDDNPVPTKGSISGSVNLYDERTNPLNNSGMLITVEGSNPQITATTNSSGKFVLQDVPFGTKVLLYEKEGYGTYKKSGVNHAYKQGSNTSLDTIVSLGRKSVTNTTAVACHADNKDLIVEVNTTPSATASNRLYVRLFFDVKSGVSGSSYKAYSENYTIGINPAEIRLTAEKINKMGFQTGDIVFVKAYGDSFWSNEYKDNASGKMVFPNLNPISATEVQVTIP
jgi:hypothetical protein